MKPPTILILDDVPYVRKLIVDELSTLLQVHVIVEAGTAIMAVELILEYRPEIIVLDINVPGGLFNGRYYDNGIDVLRFVKVYLPAAKAIMLTNNVSAYYRRECKNAGADYFFDKTAELDRFLETIVQIGQDAGYWLPMDELDKVDKLAHPHTYK